MRQAYTGQYGTNPLMTSPMGAGSEAERLVNLKRAIEAIEVKMVGTQPTASAFVPPMAYAPQMNAPMNAVAPAYAAPNPSVTNTSEMGMLQEQLNRLSSQIASSAQPTGAIDQNSIATQIVQRQQLLNANQAAQMQASSAVAPVAPVTSATLVNQPSSSDEAMHLIGKHLAGLKKELSSLKQQVSKPVAVQQTVSQEEIDRIAKAIAELQTDTQPDESAFDHLSNELEKMRQIMRKDVTQTVRREIATSNGNQANEMSTRVDARIDALRKELDSFSQKSMSDLGTRIDTLAQGLDSATLQSANAVMPQVDNLANQMDALRVTVDDLPQTLAISRLEERLNDVASKLEGLSANETPIDVSSIEGRMDEIARAIVAVSNNTGSNPTEALEIDLSALDRVEARMSDLARTIDEIATKDSTTELQNIAVRIDGLTERLGSFEKYAEAGDLGGANAMFAAPDIGMVEEQLRLLNSRIEEAAAQSQTSQLEEQLGQLAARVEEAANVNSTAAQMSNLEAQIGQIIRHMSSQESGGTVDFTPLEARLGQIENQLASNQNFSLEAAQQAAQQAVALMGDQSESGQIINALSQDLKSLQMVAESGNAVNVRTVESVQETLQQVVERLVSIEGSITDTAQARPATMVSHSTVASEENLQADTLVMENTSVNAEQLSVIHQAAVDAGFSAGTPNDKPLQVDAPSLSPADHLEKGIASAEAEEDEDNSMLEPGSAAPDLNRMVEEASKKLEETKVSLSDTVIAPDVKGMKEDSDSTAIDKSSSLKDMRPSDDLRPDAVAAARRALQATTAEMNAVKDEAEGLKKEAGKGLAGKLGGFSFAKLRKPLVMGAAALLLAVIAFKGASVFMGSDEAPIAKVEMPADSEQTIDDKTELTELPADEVPEAREVGKLEVEATDSPETKIEAVKDSSESSSDDEVIADTQKSEATTRQIVLNADQKLESEKTEQTAAETKVESSKEASIPLAEAAATDTSIEIPSSAGSAELVAAAAKGDPKALFQIGMRYSDGNGVKRNMTESAKWFEEAANKNFAPAQYSIGSLYEKGIGVERDVKKASLWYEKAAVQGNARAMHNLAVIYAMGNPPAVQPNMDKAVGWFQKAAKLGIKDSQFNLGILYGQGMGVPQNLSDSYKWFALAAKTGDSDAAAKRDEVANAMDPSDLDDARKSVNNWAPEKLTEAVNRVAIPKEWQGNGSPEKNNSASASDSALKTAQSMLNQRGFNVGSPDGLMGPKTKRAIMEFQRSAGIPITGKVDKRLLKALDIQT